MQAVILSERALADTDDLFAAAVAHVVRKLGRVKPLDPDTLPPARALTITALDLWAGSDVGTGGASSPATTRTTSPFACAPTPR